MTSRGSAQQITIRDLKSIEDLTQLKTVEKEVWGMANEDTLPLTLAIALKAAGNIFVGAFDKSKFDRSDDRDDTKDDKIIDKEIKDREIKDRETKDKEK